MAATVALPDSQIHPEPSLGTFQPDAAPCRKVRDSDGSGETELLFPSVEQDVAKREKRHSRASRASRSSRGSRLSFADQYKRTHNQDVARAIRVSRASDDTGASAGPHDGPYFDTRNSINSVNSVASPSMLANDIACAQQAVAALAADLEADMTMDLPAVSRTDPALSRRRDRSSMFGESALDALGAVEGREPRLSEPWLGRPAADAAPNPHPRRRSRGSRDAWRQSRNARPSQGGLPRLSPSGEAARADDAAATPPAESATLPAAVPLPDVDASEPANQAHESPSKPDDGPTTLAGRLTRSLRRSWGGTGVFRPKGPAPVDPPRSTAEATAWKQEITALRCAAASARIQQAWREYQAWKQAEMALISDRANQADEQQKREARQLARDKKRRRQTRTRKEEYRRSVRQAVKHGGYDPGARRQTCNMVNSPQDKARVVMLVVKHGFPQTKDHWGVFFEYFAPRPNAEVRRVVEGMRESKEIMDLGALKLVPEGELQEALPGFGGL